MLPMFQALKNVKEYLVRTYYVAKPYWTSPEYKKVAWALLLTMLAIEGVQLYLVSSLSYANRDFMDVLDNREFEKFWSVFWFWIGLFGVMLISYLAQMHVKYHLIISWREFLTNRYQARYINNGIFNQMGLKDYNVDNPDQRISQDTYNIANETIELGISLLSNVGHLVVFSFILWEVSGALEFDAMGVDFYIPGYMFWVALVYAILAIWLTHKFGKQLMPLNFERQHKEANFRFHLVRLRENAESVSLLGGEATERKQLKQEFGDIKSNWIELLKYKKRLLALNMGMGQLSQIFPYLVAMPALIAGNIAIGGLMQLRGAFMSVEASMTWFATRYEVIAEWKSSVDRIILLEEGIKAAENDSKDRRLIVEKNNANEIQAEKVSIALPTGELLAENVDFVLKPGNNVVITGTSGSGKSTLFRALSGLWLWGSGVIKQPNSKTMFIPQKSYLPKGTLREVLLYPSDGNNVSDVRLKRCMEICMLSKFIDKLDVDDDWSKVLSGGEQQRISFVRALLAEPAWLFLDESTSALDPKTEAEIYKALKRELPNTTIVSIAHRESLKQYHSVELRLDGLTKTTTLHTI